MRRLFSIGQAAKELNVSKDTVRRLALEQEAIRYVRVLRRVMIPCEEIDRVVKEGTNTRPKRYRNPKAFPKKFSHARPAR
jgi:excisionase family DNA binding protein